MSYIHCAIATQFAINSIKKSTILIISGSDDKDQIWADFLCTCASGRTFKQQNISYASDLSTVRGCQWKMRNKYVSKIFYIHNPTSREFSQTLPVISHWPASLKASWPIWSIAKSGKLNNCLDWMLF